MGGGGGESGMGNDLFRDTGDHTRIPGPLPSVPWVPRRQDLIVVDLVTTVSQRAVSFRDAERYLYTRVHVHGSGR